MPTMGAKLRELRESRGLSQEEMAKASSQKLESIKLWEADGRVLPFDAMAAICSTLGVFVTAFERCEPSRVHSRRRAKDTLPPFFKDLDLTADQKSKIADIQKSFAPKLGDLQKKIGELNKQIQGLKKDEQQGVFGVLTDDQKKALSRCSPAWK
jgi:transcriptional regulator with XRE-family HTH domain